jgi:flavin reductase (DIM6/NTAB) family NADH-FMN oxidoreductase RutF
MNSARETFLRLTGSLDYPMLVVTTVADRERSGCLVGFATQCSIDPPRFLVCLSDKNHTVRVADRAEALAVHFLPATAFALARLFGSETGDDLDKFSRCRWHAGPGDLPILDECGRWFAGTICDRRALGDHVGFLVESFAAAHDGSTDELTFQRVKQLDPGHQA